MNEFKNNTIKRLSTLENNSSLMKEKTEKYENY